MWIHRTAILARILTVPSKSLMILCPRLTKQAFGKHFVVMLLIVF